MIVACVHWRFDNAIMRLWPSGFHAAARAASVSFADSSDIALGIVKPVFVIGGYRA